MKRSERHNTRLFGWTSESAYLEVYIFDKMLYEFRYRLIGQSEWTDMHGNGNNSQQIAGLVAGMDYEFQARYWCETGFSDWVCDKVIYH